MSVDDFLAGDDGTFFTGAAKYLDAIPGQSEVNSRIYVRFQPEGVKAPSLALVDTGAHYLMLSREVAHAVEDRLVDELGKVSIRTAHGLVVGALYTLSIQFYAEVGEPLQVDVVAFVSADWGGPSVIGYTGVLDRVRFAVDPVNNWFLFG